MPSDWQSRTVVVTGSSGSGKTEVARLFEKLGALVLDADELARQAVAPGSSALKKIKEQFGERFFEGPKLDRKALAKHIFENLEDKRKLEEIVHPVVKKLAQKAYEEAGGDKLPLVIYDCPLYFEAGLNKENFRAVIVVTAPEELKIKRIVERDGITTEHAQARIAAQWPDKKKAMLAQFIISNVGTKEELALKVIETAKKL